MVSPAGRDRAPHFHRAAISFRHKACGAGAAHGPSVPSWDTEEMPMPASAAAKPARVDWVDYAKGFCIVFVVMMHSTLGVEAAAGQEGWAHAIVEFARPFRMPDFFMISGLFLARVIDRDWMTYLDRKVVHFAYFYLLWVTIQFGFKAPVFAHEHGWAAVPMMYLTAFVQPFGTLWFIYLLPIFFIVAKLARNVSPLALWIFAAGLEIAHVETGSVVIDEFAARFVYFYTGYILAPYIFSLAATVQAKPAAALAGLVLWGCGNHFVVALGWSQLPFVSLGLGLVGAGAVVSISALMARVDLLAPLRYCGENSIVIYLAFFLPMAASRAALLKLDLGLDIGTISMIVTAEGVTGAIVWFWILRRTPLWFLFKRPEWLRLRPRADMRLRPAE
jgi:uncharacterized membrane protein YcfT